MWNAAEVSKNVLSTLNSAKVSVGQLAWMIRVHFVSLVSSLYVIVEIESCTMVENREKHRQNSHPIIHCPTNEGVSKVSERANE